MWAVLDGAMTAGRDRFIQKASQGRKKRLDNARSTNNYTL